MPNGKQETVYVHVSLNRESMMAEKSPVLTSLEKSPQIVRAGTDHQHHIQKGKSIPPL